MSTVSQMFAQPGDVPWIGQSGPGGHVLWRRGAYLELCASVRLCGRQGRSGGEEVGREAWSMGQAQGETEGTPFLEVREEHLEFKG